MNVWRVQDTNNDVGKAGAVSRGFKAAYPGEAEIISLGFAPGKGYDSVGIGRQGNYMLWGWSAAPSKMTLAGQSLFLNCICYMHQYDRKPFTRIPDFIRTRDEDLVRMLNSMEQDPDDAVYYQPRYFPREIARKYEHDVAGMRKLYEDNIEYVYVFQGKFCLDEDLKSLGPNSNREVATIKGLIEMLTETSKARLAQNCLTRYTDQRFTSPSAWERWYEENAQHLVFSDAGGYRFYRIPD